MEMAYPIIQDYISKGNARSGKLLTSGKPKFIVAHDIGNGASRAYQNRTYFNREQPSASAQTFVDDETILEIIPLTEKAWHVVYDTPIDNQLFGADANDVAIGVELCWGGSINFKEAYKRYVWYIAYLCRTYALDPRTKIVPHSKLDPTRKTDVDKNAFAKNGVTWTQFINDVCDSMADSYWKSEGGVWYFYKNGAKQKGWVLDNSKWYFLDANGAMKTGWYKDPAKNIWYLLGSNGVMLTGWQKVKEKWYYMESSGAMKTGWVYLDGKWYYLNANGDMATGEITVSGKKYYLQTSGALAITDKNGAF